MATSQTSRPILPQEMFSSSVTNELLRRFGTSSFLQQLFPYYLDSLTVDYGPVESLLEDSSSGSSSSQTTDTVATSASPPADEDTKKPIPDIVPRLGRVASDAFVGIW